jgi:hypothetical protein
VSLYPRADAAQHSEIAGMRDTIDGYVEMLPAWMPDIRAWLSRLNWPPQMRDVPPDATIHDSVGRRFELPSVVQSAGPGAYRPEALRQHNDLQRYYAGPPQGGGNG